jgi:hypothetical protein
VIETIVTIVSVPSTVGTETIGTGKWHW